VLCFNDADIRLTTEGFNDKKQLNINLIVIDCLADGFTRVPYKKIKGTYKIGTDPKSLSERSPWPKDPQGVLSMLTCYPYGIIEGSPEDKSRRNKAYEWEVFFFCLCEPTHTHTLY
jgi:hypothetical protein